MKKTVLLLFVSLLLTTMAFGQIIGTTTYSLENAIIPSGNTEVQITVDDENALTFNQGSATKVVDQNGGHGAILKNGSNITMKLAVKAKVTFSLCQYSETGSTFEVSDEGGNAIASVRAESKSTNIDEEDIVFDYAGDSQVITFTINTTNTVYLHAITITNEEGLPGLEGKTQVWDFGAEQFADATIINMLDVTTVNSWYDASIPGGTTGKNLPNFTAGVLSWSGDATKDRLRSSNTLLTRYDTKSAGAYTGYVYANGTVTVTDGLPTKRYFTIQLEEDDEVSVVDMGNNGVAHVTFVYRDDVSIQNEYQEAAQNTPTQVDFIAKKAGSYLIYDAADKLSVFRITRKNAEFVSIYGDMDETNAGNIPDGYGIVFTNTLTGKSWTAVVSSGSYSIDLPAGHSYDLSLSDANGYIISGNQSVEVTASEELNITVEKITLNTLSGNISGLGTDLANLVLSYIPEASLNKKYVPEVTIDVDNGTYSVVLEPNCQYDIVAEGVNDYMIGSSVITISGDQTTDITFTAKPTYAITLTGDGLPTEIASQLSCVFTNLEEEGYQYTFAAGESIMLRDGTYSVKAAVAHEYAYEQDLTSNLVVEGAATSKSISFSEVTKWVFNDEVISNATAYKGLAFTGTVNVRGANGDLNASATTGGVEPTTIVIPVKVGQKVLLTHYYAANFRFESEDAIVNATGSTSTKLTDEYTYTGEMDGTVTVTILGTSYFTAIEVVDVMAYVATITVGQDKDYQSIDEALAAIAKMDRSDENGNIQRVTVEIDPGNYEEMLVIDQDNVTFTNASANPNIALKDAGVNIDDEAVRITSYYGHGYNYFSMSNDQKWHADVLAVNKANGYLSYENKGAGTSNGSFWNATVVITAKGFEANHIIFENSFNQYISAKEADDVVVEWANGGKGTRPVDAGNTAVQDKDFIERAAALAINGGDKIILNECKVVGHQDSFYGSRDSRVAVIKGRMMGSTDYIFGGMIAVFYKTELALLNSDDADGNDVSYITAAQQSGGRGYLMYECTVTSAQPGVEMDNTQRSKPGYFGRPWQPGTSEVVFYKTSIETTNATNFDGQSLIRAEGWLSSLSGESAGMCEYGTTEVSGVTSTSRASWATALTMVNGKVNLNDGTELNAFNFTKGSDGWDPLSGLIQEDEATAIPVQETGRLNVFQNTPNPASGSTLIRYSLEQAEDVTLTIYNSMGGVVMVMDAGRQMAGEQVINIPLGGMSGGMYFYSLRAGQQAVTKKMIVK